MVAAPVAVVVGKGGGDGIESCSCAGASSAQPVNANNARITNIIAIYLLMDIVSFYLYIKIAGRHV